MKTTKKLEVVILSTEQPSEIMVSKGYGAISYNKGKCRNEYNFNKHLYIVSKNKVDTEDWAYDVLTQRIFQCTSEDYYKAHWRKIEASTDDLLISKCENTCTNLEMNHCSAPCKPSVPKIPQSFIEAYVTIVREKREINEVDVEMFVAKAQGHGTIDTLTNMLKLNNLGEIIIHPPQSLTRKDLHTAFCAGAGIDLTKIAEGCEYHKFTEWFENN